MAGWREGCPTKGILNQGRDGKKRGERAKETHGRSWVPHISKWSLEPVEDWLRVLPDDYATVPRVVLARKEHLIHRRL